MAKYGHTRDGNTLPPETYGGPNLNLFLVTTLDRLPSIKVMGLSPMNRWYIHFTSVGPPLLYNTHHYKRTLARGLPVVLLVDTRLLLSYNINVYRTLFMNVCLVPTTVPYFLLTRVQ